MALSLLGCLLSFVAAPPEVIIYRDKWGVPSIVAKDLDGIYYGLGYMQATDNAARMALNYKIARGRSAEVLGRGQLLQDGFIRGLEIEEHADSAKLSPWAENTIAQFLAGANRALQERRNKLPGWLQPFTRTDVLSMTQFINSAFPLSDLAGALLPGVGSNQFAIGPKRSSTGHPIISMDPHLAWNGEDGGILWYEVGLYAPGLSFRGVSVPGLPAGVMGHNDRAAWSMTNNNPALAVRFTVVTDPQNRNRYSYHGEWKEFRTKPIILKFLDGGELKDQKQTLRLTDWGPMVPLRNEAAYVEPIGNFDSLEQSLAMMTARSGKQLRAALGRHGLSMWNFVYGDVDGNIGYQYNASLRRRDPKLDWRGPVRGDTPETKLGEKLSDNQLPHLENPASGILVNCNSSPTLTDPVKPIPDDWPRYITSYGKTSRYMMLSDLLKRRNKTSPEDARTIATDTEIPYARQAAQALGGPLQGWDGHTNFDSRGAVLYAYWLSQDPSLPKLAESAEHWSAEERNKAVAALEAAQKAVQRDFGVADPRWGELLRMRRGSREIGVSGFGGIVTGAPTAVNPSGAPHRGPLNGKVVANRGSSWRMIVSLEPGHVRSWSVLPYGNSHDPASPYFDNQMDLFATRRYKETSFGVEAARRTAVQIISLK